MRGIVLYVRVSNIVGTGQCSVSGSPENASISQNVSIKTWETEKNQANPRNSNNCLPDVHATASPSKPPRQTHLPLFMQYNNAMVAQPQKQRRPFREKLPPPHAVFIFPLRLY